MRSNILRYFLLLLTFHPFGFSEAQVRSAICNQVFGEDSSQNDAIYPLVKEVERGELAKVISDDSVKLDSPMFEGSNYYPITCFDDYIFFTVGLGKLVTYNLVERKKLHEVDVLGFPTGIWKVRDYVYAMHLSILGRSESKSIVLDVSSGRVLSESNVGFEGQFVRLVMNQKILTETFLHGDSRRFQSLIVHNVTDKVEEVQRCFVKELTYESPNPLPFATYALLGTSLYGLYQTEDFPRQPPVQQVNPSIDNPQTIETDETGAQQIVRILTTPLFNCQNVANELLSY
jgi:hypothetical protein